MFPGCSAAAAASLLAAAVTGLGEGPAVPLLLEGYSAYFARRIGNKAYWAGRRFAFLPRSALELPGSSSTDRMKAAFSKERR